MTLFDKKGLPALLALFALLTFPVSGAIADTLYTANNNGSVSVIDTTTETVASTILLPTPSSKPTSICLNPISPHAYTLNAGDNTISIVDTTTNTVITTISDPRFTDLTAIACAPAGTSVLIGNNDRDGTSRILYLDTSSLFLNTADTIVGKIPGSIVFNKLGTKAYILNRGVPSISVIDTATKNVISTTPLLDSDTPYALAMHTQDTYLYVVNLLGNSVTFINPATMEIYPAPLNVNTYPMGIAVSNKTNTLYVSDIFNKILVINPNTQSITSSFTSESPLTLIERNDGQKVYVASMSDNIIRSYDTSSLTTPPTNISLPDGSSPQALTTLLGTRHLLNLTNTGNGAGVVNWPFNAAYPRYLTGTVGVPENIKILVNAEAGACSLVDWAGCDSVSGGGTPSAACTVNPFTTDKTVNAVFSKNVHTITTSVSGGTGGTVSCTPEETCHGDNAICLMNSGEGSTLISLTDNGNDIKDTVTNGIPFQIMNVVANHTIIAAFRQSGSCGTSSGGTFSVAPIVNLCERGTATSLIGTGPWSWDCAGSNGGTSASCNANIQTYTVTASVTGDNGTVSCTSPVISSATATCTITPANGYQLATFTDDGVNKKGSVTGNSYVIATVTANHIIAATFSPIPPTPINGLCGASNGGTFPVTPAANFCTSGNATSLAGTGPWSWSCSGSNGGTTASCSASIQTYTVVATVTGGNGTVTCTSPANSGATATCTITPASGYQLATFTDDGADKKGSVTGDSYMIATIAANHVVAATFSQIPPTPVNGLCGASNGGTFPVTPTANFCTSGNATSLAGTGPWSWNCAGSNGGTTTSCSASIQTYTVVATVTGDNGTATCTSPVNSGATATCTITPANGYQLATFTDNGADKKGTVAGDSYAITNVTANHTIAAAFSLIPPTPINGVCGASNGRTFSATPTANFCTSGTATSLAGSGPWNWSCTGSNGGTTAGCSAGIQTYTVAATVTGDNGAASCTSPVNSGATATCTVTPANGYQLATFTDDGVDKKGSVTGNSYVIATVTANHVVAATFSQIPPTPINGLCGVSNGRTFSVAPTANFCAAGDATSLAGTGPWSWSCTGSNSGATASCSATIQTYTVTATVTGGNGTVTCTSPVNSGAAAKCDVIPESGYQLATFTDDGADKKGSVTGDSYVIAAITANHTIAATFSQIPPTPINGVCGASNDKTFPVTPTANFCTSGTATSLSGTGPWNWNCTGSNGGTTASCSADIQTYTVVASVTGGNGTVSCTSPVNSGATATCTITPESGYQLATFTDDGADKKDSVTDDRYLITTVTANHSIAATFSQIPPTPISGVCGASNGRTFPVTPAANFCTSGTATSLAGTGPWNWNCTGSNGGSTASCSAVIQTYTVVATVTGGNGTVSCASPVNSGAAATCTITPASGYQLATFTDDGADKKGSVAGDSYMITTITANHAIAATFSQIPPTPINGLCGASNGRTFAASPTANFCISGDTTSVFGTGPWEWNCTGRNGGTTATCNANIQTYTVAATVTGGNGTVSCTSPVSSGAAATCAITPVSGYQLATFTDDGADKKGSVTGSSYMISAITANHTIAATFSQIPPTPINGLCGVSNGKTFSVMPTDNFCTSGDATGVVGTGPWNWSCSGRNGGTTATCNANIQTYTVTATVTGGNGTVSCTSPVNSGAAAICVVTPANWYQLATFTDGSVDKKDSVTGGSYVMSTVTANHTITATFSQIPSTPVSGLCGASNNKIFSVAPTANFCTSGAATSLTGSGPWNWNCTGSNGGTTAYCNASIQAYTLAASVTGGNGTINCTSPVNSGAPAACNITPANGYHLLSLTDNGASGLHSITNKNTYTLNKVTSSHSIKASFAAYSLADALQALRTAVKIISSTPEELLWLDVAPLDTGKPKGNNVIDIMDALVLLKQSIGSYTGW